MFLIQATGRPLISFKVLYRENNRLKRVKRASVIITERDIPEDQSIIWLFIKGQSVKATCDCTKTKSVFEIYYQDHKFSNKLWESLHPKTSLNRVLIFKYSYEDLFNLFKRVLNLYFTLSDVTICDDYCIKFYSKHIPDFT